MKIRTLKITQNEYNLISSYVHSDKCLMGITLPLDDEFGCFVNVHNVNRFRKSLIAQISKNFTNCKELINYNRFNDILSKLNNEVN